MSKNTYNPIPPRVWSRVENPCIFIVPGSEYKQAFIPLTGQFVSQAQANYETLMINKGNVLQYKGNSARLTKRQKYSQLARMAGPNRTKVFATQTQTYSNPNTTGLLRQNFNTYPFPNEIVGVPNNISGPFAYGIPNPNDCSSNTIIDGGTLVCGTFANPCSGEIIKRGNTSATICAPASASNVPGPSVLCWNNKVQTWFPRQRYFMNNSTDKWPVNYKGLVSAIKPSEPSLIVDSNTCNSVTLSWVGFSNSCIPISSYNIYQNDILIRNVPYTITSTTIDGLTIGQSYSFYITSVSNTNESIPSNIVLFNNTLSFIATGPHTYTVDSNCNYTVNFTGNGTIIFNNANSVNYIVTGGGGKGGDGPSGGGINAASGGGGGGAGGTNTGNFSPTLTTLYTITIGGSQQPSSILSIITSNAGSNGFNGSSVTSTGGAGGAGGAGTIPGNNGAKGGNAGDFSGGAGGGGGAGYNTGYGVYGKGGNGGRGGDSNGGFGQSGSPGNSGAVILSFTG